MTIRFSMTTPMKFHTRVFKFLVPQSLRASFILRPEVNAVNAHVSWTARKRNMKIREWE